MLQSITKGDIVFGIVFVLIIGLGRILAALLRTRERITFVQDYLTRFSNLIAHMVDGQFDHAQYIWLTGRVVKMQAAMGPFGVLDYRPPFLSYIIQNYQVLINTLPEIRNGTAHPHQIGMCSDALLRYSGVLADIQRGNLRQLCNPFVWLREGVHFLFTLPLRTLSWIGFFNAETFDNLANSGFVQRLSSAITLIGLVGSVVTIVLGWETFWPQAVRLVTGIVLK